MKILRIDGTLIAEGEGTIAALASEHRADLRDANLRGANLSGAYLRGADLRGADLGGATMPGGETWEEYLSEVVPALLVAGGHPLAEVATERAWACHDWANCPMAGAFDAHSVDDVPLLHRPRAVEFIQFFDARLIPRPEA